MIIRNLRTTGMFLFHSLVAILGSAIIESPIYKQIPVHTVSATFWKSWILSSLVATSLGFSMYRLCRSTTAKFVWILPTLAFCVVVIPTLGPHLALRNFLGDFSAGGCEDRAQGLGCVVFVAFTVIFLRGVFYSAAAWMAAKLYAPATSTEGQSVV